MAEGQVPFRHRVSLSKRTLNMAHKVPYVDVISDAILASPYRRLTAKEIFEQISVKYGPMKKAETLKNTIRHTLSRYKVFRKVQRGRQKKPNWWTVDEEAVQALDQAGQRQQTEWRSQSTISVGHPAQQQQRESPTFSGVQQYLPATGPSLLFSNAPLTQTPGYEPASAFQEPAILGPVFNSGYLGRPAMPIPDRIAGLAAVGPSLQQLVAGMPVRGGHYIPVENFAATAVTPIAPIAPLFCCPYNR